MRKHPVSESTCKPDVNLPEYVQGVEAGGVPVEDPVIDTEQGEDEDGVVEISEEVEPIKTAPSPTMPSAAEAEEHRVTHYPFRSWCRECVMGRGLGERRGRHRDRDHRIAIVGIDYFYITSKGLVKRDDMVEEYALDAEGRRICGRPVPTASLSRVPSYHGTPPKKSSARLSR